MSLPGMQDFCINTERSNAGGSHIFESGFSHQSKMTGDDGHDSLDRYDIGMITDTCASRVSRIVENSFSQFIIQYIQISPFGPWKKGLTNTTSRIIIPIISNLFLIIIPYLLFTFQIHFFFLFLHFSFSLFFPLLSF